MILQSLGTGVYGEVVKCLNMNTKQTVAVKILKNVLAAKVAEQEVLSDQSVMISAVSVLL